MKNVERMHILCKQADHAGYAAVMAIAGILAVSLGAGIYLKRAQIFSGFSFVESSQRLKEQELIATSESVRKSVADTLNNRLSISPTTSELATSAFSDFLAANVVNVFNANSDNLALGQSLSLTCLNQIAPDPVNALALAAEPCSFHRDRMPKTFQLVMERHDAQSSVTLRLTQEFKIDRATINRFSYIITASKEDIVLGNTTFEGPTGLFFSPLDNNNNPFAGNIVFAGLGSGTVFKDILFTSVDSATGLVHRTGAQSDIGRVAFSQPQVFSKAVEDVFAELKVQAAVRPNTRQQALAACIAAHPNTGCTSVPDYAAYEILPGCDIRVVETSRSFYKSATGQYIEGPRATSDSGAVPQVAGRIYYVEGTALFHGSTAVTPKAPYKDAVMCAPQTFLADSIKIGSSIVKSGPTNNIWLLSTGDITLEPVNFTVLCSNNSNYCASGVCNQCSSAGLASGLEIKSGARTISDGYTGLRIQATMTTSSGSFKIPESFMDSNPDYPAVGPRAFGRLETQGLIVESQPTFSSKTWAGSNGSTYTTGFRNVTMIPEYRLVENPPPGLTFAVNIGLMQALTSSSLVKVDIGEAIKNLE